MCLGTTARRPRHGVHMSQANVIDFREKLSTSTWHVLGRRRGTGGNCRSHQSGEYGSRYDGVVFRQGTPPVDSFACMDAKLLTTALWNAADRPAGSANPSPRAPAN